MSPVRPLWYYTYVLISNKNGEFYTGTTGMKILVSGMILLIMIVSFLSLPVFCADKDLMLTTVDISADYEIIGIIYARVGSTDINDLNDELRRRAAKVGADAVIGVRYMPYVGYLYAYGTAVEFKQ